ncbi:2-hydroxychromene-2-carboxylate isomerase [Bacillus thermotolerans]|nr:2-hydroxychromene-2-carboxylate isomerase [Bacillus thermotolerans]
MKAERPVKEQKRWNAMNIKVWSDFVCPFCYIGKRRLEQALEQFPNSHEVTVEFKSFELDPHAPKEATKTVHESIAEKYGLSLEQAKSMNENVGHQAASVGLAFNFENMRPSNTFDAHRLAKFASEKGAEKVITEKLLHAYFTDSLVLSDHHVLTSIAESAGLDCEEVLEFLKTDRLAGEVRADEAEAGQLGVQGVPFFVFNDKYAVSGAQSVEAFTSALERVWREERQVPRLQTLTDQSSDAAFCSDEGCDVPTNGRLSSDND